MPAGSCDDHLCGRSPRSTDGAWRWGESPFFPTCADRLAWSAGKAPFTATECVTLVDRTRVVLRDIYGEWDALGISSARCGACGYPTPTEDLDPATGRCPECR